MGTLVGKSSQKILFLIALKLNFLLTTRLRTFTPQTHIYTHNQVKLCADRNSFEAFEHYNILFVMCYASNLKKSLLLNYIDIKFIKIPIKNRNSCIFFRVRKLFQLYRTLTISHTTLKQTHLEE